VKRLLYQDPSVMREVGSGASGHPRLPIIAVKSLRVDDDASDWRAIDRSNLRKSST
jgi:hypothetical protein